MCLLLGKNIGRYIFLDPHIMPCGSDDLPSCVHSTLDSPGSQRLWFGQGDPIPAGRFPRPVALPSSKTGDYGAKLVWDKLGSQRWFLPFYIVENI